MELEAKRRFEARKATGMIPLANGETLYFIEGRQVPRDEYDARFPSRLHEGLPHVAVFAPLESVALAVHPSQVQEANEQARKHGTGAAYDSRGRVHFPTRESRRREMKVRGYHDNDGGYSDG